jgi:hypothetical protein
MGQQFWLESMKHFFATGADISLEEFDSCRQIRDFASAQVINNCHIVPHIQQSFSEMGPNEARPAGYEDPHTACSDTTPFANH